jgi:hypothetical protein
MWRSNMNNALRVGFTVAASAVACLSAMLFVPTLAAAPHAATVGNDANPAATTTTDAAGPSSLGTGAPGARSFGTETPSRSEPIKGVAGERGESTDAADRIREGTRWQNERGVFTLVGDRVTFTPNSLRNQNFMVLENLNLERIVRTIEENRTVTDADTLEWNIDGTVTEFRGGNFVIVTRSVLVARPRSTDAGR